MYTGQTQPSHSQNLPRWVKWRLCQFDNCWRISTPVIIYSPLFPDILGKCFFRNNNDRIFVLDSPVPFIVCLFMWVWVFVCACGTQLIRCEWRQGRAGECVWKTAWHSFVKQWKTLAAWRSLSPLPSLIFQILLVEEDDSAVKMEMIMFTLNNA